MSTTYRPSWQVESRKSVRDIVSGDHFQVPHQGKRVYVAIEGAVYSKKWNEWTVWAHKAGRPEDTSVVTVCSGKKALEIDTWIFVMVAA
jgi:hypothetical protein